jgi:hypothetical protein
LLDESSSGGGIFALVSMEQGQVGGPLEVVMHHESLSKIFGLWLISHLKTCCSSFTASG